MTREQVSQTLRYMEQIREDSGEAEPPVAKRLIAEYGRLWRIVKPYVEGKTPYTRDGYR